MPANTSFLRALSQWYEWRHAARYKRTQIAYCDQLSRLAVRRNNRYQGTVNNYPANGCSCIPIFRDTPPASWLEDKFGHPLLSYSAILVTFLGGILLVSQILYSSLSEFSSEVDNLSPIFNERIEQVEGMEFYGYSIDLAGLKTVVSIEEINRLVTEFIGSLASFTANLLTVLIFLAFIILEAESLPRRITAAFPEETARFDNIASKAERNINVYIKTKATVALGQAVIAGIALTLFDIPGAFIWAFLVFLLDFIPYLGGFSHSYPRSFSLSSYWNQPDSSQSYSFWLQINSFGEASSNPS